MGCGCKNNNDSNGQVNQEEDYNILGNAVVRVLLFIIVSLILPLALPVMWYMLFIHIFKNGKGFDLYPSVKGLVKMIMGKKFNKNNDDDDDDDEFDVEDLEIVTQIDEIDKNKGR